MCVCVWCVCLCVCVCVCVCVSVREYDNISPLDNWMTTMLLRVKKTIGACVVA